jgi:rfaE bifunctional protein kinase chain/domain
MLIDRLKDLVHAMHEPRVLVVGDLMLDHYYWGDATRISPEAPVPVVTVIDETHTVGGAGNVALNAAAYGGEVHLVGSYGADSAGEKLASKCNSSSITLESFARREGVRTIVKSRVFVQKQQLCRIDTEDNKNKYAFENKTIECLCRMVSNFDVVLLSDYAKGAVTVELNEALALACANRAFLAIDPKPSNKINYTKPSLMTPNRLEAIQLSGFNIGPRDPFPAAEVCKSIDEKFHPTLLAVTLGADGIVLAQGGKIIGLIPTLAKDVFDVSGAGDTVVSTMALALRSGASPVEAAVLANCAAGIVISKVGTAVITIPELMKKIDEEEDIISKL